MAVNFHSLARILPGEPYTHFSRVGEILAHKSVVAVVKASHTKPSPFCVQGILAISGLTLITEPRAGLKEAVPSFGASAVLIYGVSIVFAHLPAASH